MDDEDVKKRKEGRKKAKSSGDEEGDLLDATALGTTTDA